MGMQDMVQDYEAHEQAVRERAELQAELNGMTKEQRDERLDAIMQAEADEAEREADLRRIEEHETIYLKATWIRCTSGTSTTLKAAALTVVLNNIGDSLNWNC